MAIEVELDNTFEVAREDDTVAALGVDGLDALDVAVGRDLQVVLDAEPLCILSRATKSSCLISSRQVKSTGYICLSDYWQVRRLDLDVACLS